MRLMLVGRRQNDYISNAAVVLVLEKLAHVGTMAGGDDCATAACMCI